MAAAEWLERCRLELNRMANGVFETPELGRYFARPLTRPREQVRSAMMRYYFVPNRRDCWAYVQAVAPIDVKQAIWHHEEDELIFDERIGRAHVTDSQSDGDLPAPLPAVRVACYGWLYIAMKRPWLEGLASSHILERINDPTVIQGDPLVQRHMKQKMADLGIKLEQLDAGSRVHLEADEEHSGLIWAVFEKHVKDEATCRQVVNGAKESLECFRVYAGGVGEAMAKAFKVTEEVRVD